MRLNVPISLKLLTSADARDYVDTFTWPNETGLAHSHAHLNWFPNVLKPV